MRAVVQRVSEAEVRAAAGRREPHAPTGAISHGLLVLVGVTHDDTPEQARALADKAWRLRVFDDDDGHMNLAAADVGAGVLVVSQFTLYGDTRKGRRPSYLAAARPDVAEPLVDTVAARLREHGAHVATGRFGAHMQIDMTGDGPVTILLEL